MFTFVLIMHFDIVLPHFCGFFLKASFLGHFFDTLNSRPVDTISDWLATSAENWKRIEIGIDAEDLSEVIVSANVVLTFVIGSLLVETLDRSFVIHH